MFMLATSPVYQPEDTLLDLADAVAADPQCLHPHRALLPVRVTRPDGGMGGGPARPSRPEIGEERLMAFPPNLRIAQSASLKPLGDVAAGMGIGPHLLEAVRRARRQDQALARSTRWPTGRGPSTSWCPR